MNCDRCGIEVMILEIVDVEYYEESARVCKECEANLAKRFEEIENKILTRRSNMRDKAWVKWFKRAGNTTDIPAG